MRCAPCVASKLISRQIRILNDLAWTSVADLTLATRISGKGTVRSPSHTLLQGRADLRQAIHQEPADWIARTRAKGIIPCEVARSRLEAHTEPSQSKPFRLPAPFPPHRPKDRVPKLILASLTYAGHPLAPFSPPSPPRRPLASTSSPFPARRPRYRYGLSFMLSSYSMKPWLLWNGSLRGQRSKYWRLRQVALEYVYGTRPAAVSQRVWACRLVRRAASRLTFD